MPAGLKFLLRDDRRLLDEAVRHRLAERIVVDHVLERHRRPWLVSTNGVAVSSSPRTGFSSLIARTPGRRPVAVRLVHDQDEVVQPGQVVEVALRRCTPTGA